MSKLDIVEKIKAKDLLSALFDKYSEKPFTLINQSMEVGNLWQENYFCWGRSALYYLFKSLPFKTISFPAFTCSTLVWAAEKAGKKVDLLEIDKNTFNIDINKLDGDLECVVAVHTFGNPLDIDEVKEKCPNAFIIEDCAHALLSKINGDYVGSKGDAVLFSLYKQIANINGALLLTKNTKVDRVFNLAYRQAGFRSYKQIQPWYKKLKRVVFKTNGPHQLLLDWMRKKYLPVLQKREITDKKPSKLALSLFNRGFRKLKKEVGQRRKTAKVYYRYCQESPYFRAQKAQENSDPSFYHFVIRLSPNIADIRDKLLVNLRQKNIFLGRLWYDVPITFKRYKKFGKNCPNALDLARSVISLPIKSEFSEADIIKLFKEMTKEIEIIKANKSAN